MGKKGILIIEDDAAVRESLKESLEIQGYQIFLASNGQDGVEQLRRIAPLPCVVLLDLMMPGMNGWQFLDSIHNDPALKNTPVVICSAYNESARAIKPGATVEKPIQLNSLLDAIKAFGA